MLEVLKTIVKHNEKEMERVNWEQNFANNLYTIEHEGTEIYDFFNDETLRDEVNPIEYYGKEKLLAVIKAYNENEKIKVYALLKNGNFQANVIESIGNFKKGKDVELMLSDNGNVIVMDMITEYKEEMNLKENEYDKYFKIY